MSERVSSENVRSFIITKYAAEFERAGVSETELSDEFDLLSAGIIDSLGILEMITAIEDRFAIHLDLEQLDASALTQIGPLTNFIASHSQPRS